MDYEVNYETNVELITRVMEESRCGGLMQGFIMERLKAASESVIKNETQVIASMQNSIVCPEAWVACAKELFEELTSPRRSIKRRKPRETRD